MTNKKTPGTGKGTGGSDKIPAKNLSLYYTFIEFVIFPQLYSLSGRTLARLLSGKSLDAHNFQNETGSQRLPVSISNLWLHKHWPIEREQFKKAVIDNGRIVIREFKRYWLPQWTIDAIGQRGVDFVALVTEYENGESE